MKYLLIIIFSIAVVSAKAQFTGTDSLRNYNNRYITTNPATAFTNNRLNTLLRGIIDFIDTARAGGSGAIQLGIDTVFAVNDSTIRYRKNGVFRQFTLKGVYDSRRKVDTIYKSNDTTLTFTVNGNIRTVIIPGGTNLNLATANQTATGNRTHNWDNHWLYINNLKSFGLYQDQPDANHANNNYKTQITTDSSVDGTPLQLMWGLRNIDDDIIDSVHFELTSKDSATYLYHYGDEGSKSAKVSLNGNSPTADIRMDVINASKSSSFILGNTANLSPADSILIKSIPAATSDTILATRAFSDGVNTVIKIPASAITGKRFGLEDNSATANRTFNANGYNFNIDSVGNWNVFSKSKTSGADRGALTNFGFNTNNSINLWSYIPGSSTRSYGFNAYGALTQMFAAGHVAGHATYVQSDTLQVILEADPNRLYMFHDSVALHNITGGAIDFRIRTLPQTIDTTNFKPLAIGPLGQVKRFTGWAGGGGGSTETASEGLIKFGNDIRLGNTDSSTTGQATVNRYIIGTSGKKIDISGSWFESDTTRRKITGQYYKDTLFYFGDSHTVGDLALTISRRFSSLTALYCGYAERNFGVGGTTMVGNTTIIPNIPYKSAATPGSKLIINFGTNDVITGQTMANFKTDYYKWIDTAVARGWTAATDIVVMQPEYSTLSPYVAGWTELKDTVTAIANFKGTLLLKTWDLMAADAAEGFVASDGYHPNDNGHAFTAYYLSQLIKGSVKNSSQVMAINGNAEFQTLYYKNADSAAYTSLPLGVDSTGKMVKFKPNAFIRNNKTTNYDAADFGITGVGYAKTSLSSQRLELIGSGSARNVGVKSLQAWLDGSGTHIWGVDWAAFAPVNMYLNEFSGSVQIGPGTLNTGGRLSVGGNIISNGSVQAMAAFAGNSAGAANQLYYAAGGYGGLQAYDYPNSLSKPLVLQEFGNKVQIGNSSAFSSSYRFEVDGESYSADRISTGRNRTFGNQGLTGLSLSISDATYTDNNTSNGGTVAHVAAASIGQPTLAAMGTGITFTKASTLYIKGDPVAGTNVTNTNPFALYIETGRTRLGTADSTSSPVNMLYQDTDGTIKKASVPSGGINAINSHAGPAITVQGGTALSVDNSVSNVVTFNVTPSSNSIPHTLDAIYTTAGNTGTSETDLFTYTLPANKLSIDGRTVNFEIDGEFNDNTATAQLKLHFAGNVTLNTGAVNISTAFTAWRLKGYIIRTSSSTAHVTYELHCPGLATPVFVGYNNLTSLNFATTNTLKITAQAGGGGGSTGDITAHSWQILYKPAP